MLSKHLQYIHTSQHYYVFSLLWVSKRQTVLIVEAWWLNITGVFPKVNVWSQCNMNPMQDECVYSISHVSNRFN